MEKKSRSENVLINSWFGFINQIVKLILVFISRTLFVNFLGEEYLGINGLYNNILTVLSLADLGLDNVVYFSLYKPVFENNKEQIVKLMQFYKKLYNYIMLIVLFIGILLIPILPYIVKSNLEYNWIIFYYILNLLNSISSYFAIYKSALINANQKNYIITRIQTFFTIIQNVGQIILLIITKNYTLYLIFQVICTIIMNIVISIKTDKLYPYLQENRNHCKISSEEKKDIFHNLKSTFLYRMGIIIMNYTDNILISIIIGTVYVGYYSNYGLLISAINTFIGIFTQGIISSLGNLNADQDKEKPYQIFNILVLIYHWITAVCSICFLIIINDFISIWIGERYILSSFFVYALVFNFYIQNIINPIWMYRTTCGLFSEIKYIMLLTAILNIILSIFFGVYFGIAGIIAATPISRCLTVVWYEPKILLKKVFKKKTSQYWKSQIKYCFITLLSMVVCIISCNCLSSSIFAIIMKVIIISIETSLMFLLFNKNNFVLRDLSSMISQLFYKKHRIE